MKVLLIDRRCRNEEEGGIKTVSPGRGDRIPLPKMKNT